MGSLVEYMFLKLWLWCLSIFCCLSKSLFGVKGFYLFLFFFFKGGGKILKIVQGVDMELCGFNTKGRALERVRKGVGEKKKLRARPNLQVILSLSRHVRGHRRLLPTGMSQGCGQHHKHLLGNPGLEKRAMFMLPIKKLHFGAGSLSPSAFGLGECGLQAAFPVCHFISGDYDNHLQLLRK